MSKIIKYNIYVCVYIYTHTHIICNEIMIKIIQYGNIIDHFILQLDFLNDKKRHKEGKKGETFLP